MQRKPTKRYWRAFGALYGRQLDLGVEIEGKKAKPKKAKPDCPKEQEEQFRASCWMKKHGVVHNHSPNGGYRDIREAAKFKRMGVSPGYPDFQVPYARKGYHGLYIELKRLYGGKLSEHQIWWRDFLLKEGNAWYEAKGADECIDIVCDYLGLIRNKDEI